MSIRKMQPASKVVTTLGGVRATARALDISPSTVSRWMSPREDGGTGGRIPQRHWPALLAVARKRKVSLALEDLAGIKC